MPIIGGTPPADPNSQAQPGQDIVKLPNTTFSYSMTRLADLEASEYTQVAITSDASPSVEGFKKAMEDMLATIVETCKLSPRALNLLMRHTIFHTRVKENHGWKMLNNILPTDYDNCLKIGGGTAVYDAAYEAVEVMRDSGEKLTASRFTVNGIVFIITDGEDNSSHYTPTQVKTSLDEIRQKEKLESLVTILIGVGCGEADDPATGKPKTPRDYREQQLYDYLTAFKDNAGLTHFIPMKDASKSNLAKLAAFISKSISDQSQALGTGGPSKALTSQTLTI